MNRKENYVDLDKWRQTKKKQKRRYYGKSQNAENRNQPWTNAEIQIVLDHKLTDKELSVLLGRSVNAIQVIRCKQKALN